MFKFQVLQVNKEKLFVESESVPMLFNPIPAGGGANLTPPEVLFHNSKNIGLRLLTFSDFS